MAEPTAHTDTFIRDNLPPEADWPEMDYSVLPELAAYPARFNVAVELLDKQVESGLGDRPFLYWGRRGLDLRRHAGAVEPHRQRPGRRARLSTRQPGPAQVRQPSDADRQLVCHSQGRRGRDLDHAGPCANAS